MHAIVDASALAQTAVYMAGVLTGYALLTPTEELQRVWNAVRSTWRRKE
jgi:hypothetical protein